MRNKIFFEDQESDRIQGNNSLRFGAYPENEKPGTFESVGGVYSDETEVLNYYTRQLGFTNNSEMIVLSSTNHYFYDAEEMRTIRVIKSDKEFNRIRDIKSFLRSLYINLQPKSFFIGYFTDNHKKNNSLQDIKSTNGNSDKLSEDIENGIRSRYSLLNKIYSVLDSNTYNMLSGRTMEIYLRDSGFKVIDMTLIDGITYFCAQRKSSSDN